MTEKLDKTIKEELIKLPIEIQKAVNSSDWANITENVGRKFYLSDNEINILQLEVGLILLGYKNLDLFALNIESSVVIDANSSTQMADELIEKIFDPLLIKINEDIKINLPHKAQTWKQSINFIVSGGDYSVFIENN